MQRVGSLNAHLVLCDAGSRVLAVIDGDHAAMQAEFDEAMELVASGFYEEPEPEAAGARR